MEPTFTAITILLEKKHIPFKVQEHAPVYSSVQAAEVRGLPLTSGVKAMLLKTPKRFILVLIRADKKVDFKQFKKLEGTSKLRLATAEEVLEETHCEPGSVPPFGHPKPFKTYVDRDLLEEKHVTFNAGLLTKSVIMAGKDLLKVLDPILFS